MFREQRYREELDLLRSEVDKSREGETNWRRRLEQREGQLIALKGELEAEQKTITCLEVEVKDLQSKLAKDDTSFRNEVRFKLTLLIIRLM
jgi:chromosome segregation ATPase